MLSPNTLIYKFLLAVFLVFGGNLIAQSPANNAEKDKKTPTTTANQKDSKAASPAVNSPPVTYNTWLIGIHGGVTNFWGDIRNYDFGQIPPFFSKEDTKSKSEFQWGAGAMVQKNISSMFGVRLSGTYGRLSGTITVSKTPKTRHYFLANFWDASLNGVIYLSNIHFNPNKEYKNRKALIYATLGVGTIGFSGKYRKVSNDSLLLSYGSYIRPILPIGLGIKYPVSMKSDIGLEFSYRPAITDKIDGYEAKGSGNDSYSYLNLNYTYYFGRGDQNIDRVHPFADNNDKVNSMEATIANMRKDKDKDGVPDYLDQDNNTPPGTIVGPRGVPVDVDGDGVNDAYDMDLTTPKGDPVDKYGVSTKDSDGDGVPDHRDQEPNSPPNAIVNFKGQSVTGTTPTANNAGNNNTTVINKYSGSNLFLNVVYFDFNDYTVKGDFYPQIAEVANLLKTTPELRVNLSGHTDIVGSEATNQKLSQIRADAVAKILTDVYGIPANKIKTQSFGKSKPLSVNKMKAVQATNRRVEIRISLDKE
ncbi:MAG: OmpA family protein [Bacteroidia bacterium]|nr:OmpA family protein [Bacteroidia bacterium]